MESITLALAGDTMLGRMVADAIERGKLSSLFEKEVVEAARSADLFVLNLECCVSLRGERWPDPAKPFFFRAPPAAIAALVDLGVDCVTLANNHALDYGEVALLDTLGHLRAAGISCVGAGSDEREASSPCFLEANGFRLAVIGVTDHPRDFAAGPAKAGVAYADFRGRDVPAWLTDAIARARTQADAVLVTPHWGPNMVTEPVPHVLAICPLLLDAGATMVAGHSAHVFQGVGERVLWDLGDFIDDYAVDPRLRNDLGVLWFVTLQDDGPSRIEALPLALDYCHTRVARGDEIVWIRRRLEEACRALGTGAEVGLRL